MKRLPTAAALAILLVTAGIAGVVSAEPNSTDYESTSTDVAETPPEAADRATFEERLTHRLQQFDLTDAQVREIVTEASRLRDAGASRLVIHSSIVTNLYGFGVDAPFLYAEGDDERPNDHPRLHRFIWSLDVTPEQARELHAVAHRMHEVGATNEEIRSAIRRMVASYDDEIDDHPDSVDRLVGSLVDRYDLDRAQAAEIDRLIRGMLDDGADRTEIHEAVSRLLESYEVDQDRPADALARDRATNTAVARVR